MMIKDSTAINSIVMQRLTELSMGVCAWNNVSNTIDMCNVEKALNETGSVDMEAILNGSQQL